MYLSLSLLQSTCLKFAYKLCFKVCFQSMLSKYAFKVCFQKLLSKFAGPVGPEGQATERFCVTALSHLTTALLACKGAGQADNSLS